MIEIKEIKTKEDFSDFIEYNKSDLHIVKFGAEWCGPCRLLEQRLKNLDETKIGNTLFAEIGIDDQDSEEMELATQFGISNIPVMLYFKNGDVVRKTVGALDALAIYKIIGELTSEEEK